MSAGNEERLAKRNPRRPTRRERIDYFLDRLELRASSGKSIDGLWIGVSGDKSSPALQRVENALALIRTHDPLNYRRRRVIRELQRVWVRILVSASGLYSAKLGACELDTRFVDWASEELIASIIVHEATHARLVRCGIDYEEKRRVRVERVCIRRQLVFTTKLPNGDEAHKRARESLASLSPETYTNQAFSEREQRGSAEALRYIGVPEWVIRAAFRMREWMDARQQRRRHSGPPGKS